MKRIPKTPDQKRDQWLRNQLRRITQRWAPAGDAKKLARVDQRLNPKSGRIAWHSKCAICGAIKPESQMNLDHLVPIVPTNRKLTRKEDPTRMDWNAYIDRAFPYEAGWQVICETPCHEDKTQKENAERRASKQFTEEELERLNKKKKGKNDKVSKRVSRKSK